LLVKDINEIFDKYLTSGSPHYTLLFSHPDERHGLTNEGIPQISLDQLNPRMMFHGFTPPTPSLCNRNRIRQIWDSGVLHYITKAQHLTRGKLIKQDDWGDWNSSEFTQLDQYKAQGLFGAPRIVTSDKAVFNLVWTYMIKDVDKCKKARCTCDGSPRSGQVWVLDYTYANCVDQTSAWIFYAVLVAENLIIFGADVSNAFAEAPPPKQGFYIRPDNAFCNWWVNHKKRDPIPHGAVILVLLAMQGHPKSPRLWEKHADRILCKIGLFPTTHKPCLYSCIINGQRVLFLQQVDDFAIACSDESTANGLLNMIDAKLTIPLKWMGLLDLNNGLNVIQTWDYQNQLLYLP
jgi:hypothetical protein